MFYPDCSEISGGAQCSTWGLASCGTYADTSVSVLMCVTDKNGNFAHLFFPEEQRRTAQHQQFCLPGRFEKFVGSVDQVNFFVSFRF